MQKILVTGSTGFIGSHLVGKLCDRYKLICIVRDGNRIKSFKSKNIKVVFCDLANKRLLMKIFYNYSFDTVIHLAYEELGKDSKKVYKKNLRLTNNLLECIAEKKIKHFIFMSTCAIYDKIPMGKKANEDYQINAKSYYAKSKIKSEKLIKKYASRFSFSYTIFRAHMVYGDGDKNISELISLMKKSKIIPLINNGNYYVQPMFAGDVISALVKSINNKKVFNKTYNLAGLAPVLFKDLAILISKEINSKKIFINVPFIVILPEIYLLELLSRIVHRSLWINRTIIKRAIQNSAYNISKVKKDLNLKPMTIEEGIKRIINKNEYNIN